MVTHNIRINEEYWFSIFVNFLEFVENCELSNMNFFSVLLNNTNVDSNGSLYNNDVYFFVRKLKWYLTKSIHICKA